MDREAVDAFLASAEGVLRDDPISPDAMHWVPPQERFDYDLPLTPLANAVPIAARFVLRFETSGIAEAYERMIEATHRAAEEMHALAAQAITDYRAVAVIDEANTWERAMRLRRNRNTGPAQHGRAPRSIDPHGHR